MKLMHAASTLSTLLLAKEAASLTCPDASSSKEWGQTELYGGYLTFTYATVTSSLPEERGILCARLESKMESYIGFGISPSGRMNGGEAVIGLPDEGTVKKYTLSGARSAVPMDDSNQTLMDEQITQTDGKTLMVFTKYLLEDGEHDILATGENIFLYALGRSNSLAKHEGGGDFKIDFGDPLTPPAPTADNKKGTESGVMGKTIAGTIVVGAGLVAIWFGL